MSACSKCLKPHYAKGLCRSHYHQHRIESNTRPCDEPGCSKNTWSRGFCLQHYNYHTYRATLPRARTKRNADSTCLESGCEKPGAIKGHCRNHYYVKSRRGEIDTRTRHGLASCGEDECDKIIYAKGMCSGHYHRALRERMLDEGRIAKCSADECPNQAVRNGKCRAHGRVKTPNTKPVRPRSQIVPAISMKLRERQKELVANYPDRFEWDEAKQTINMK